LKLIDVLLIGGRGNIGAGLRTYLPQLDDSYRVTSIDLPGAFDQAIDPDAHSEFIDLDVSTDDAGLRKALEGRDLVVYLARKDPLTEMNAMTDQVFNAVLDVCPKAVMIGSSSVHATGGAYYHLTHDPDGPIAHRRFDEVVPWPEPLSVMTEPCPTGDYGVEKAYVEAWCHRLGAVGQSAVAARWGGINPTNGKRDEISYYTVWCHQEDAARFADACYKTARAGKLRPSAHYYVISDNTYSVFDIETTRREIGYEPQHNAESFYGVPQAPVT
jgi:nucleoside-diphosphate-sugar epimerase